MHISKPTPGNAWSWVGLCLSLAMNAGAAWVVYTVVSKPDPILKDPTPPCYVVPKAK